MAVAKDARHVDVLCYRIYLSYRLLDGTTRFKELHKTVKEAKDMLQSVVETTSGVSASVARCIISRLSLSMACKVQRLCGVAVAKAEELLKTISEDRANDRAIVEDSRTAACKLLFEEVSVSSISIILLKPSSALSETIKGYKLWYGKSGEPVKCQEPACVFPRDQMRIMISNLQPCTEYVFHVVSYTEAGDFGHSQLKCFTRSLEVAGKVRNAERGKKRASVKENELCSVKLSQSQRGCLEGFCCVETHKCHGASPEHDESVRIDDSRSVPHELDLRVATVPDLNVEVVPPFEYSRDDDNSCSLARAVEADRDTASHVTEKQKAAGSNRIDPQTDVIRTRTVSAKDEVHDSYSTLINGSPSNLPNSSGCLDENFEYCVKIIRFLESTEQERRVVNTFVQTDDLNSLSGQLIDTFFDAVSSKRHRNDFFSKP